MCGGSKGQSSSSGSQSQTYTPNAQAGNYINSALQQAQSAAQLPFNIPQAPVAGFSQDQQSAFNTINNAQGMAQPYINQAQSYFSPEGAQQFYNPMASAVTAQMNNVFGQQQAQTTGQLTQAAGGLGADRIAVGQANLANQQGLAAGQTYANLYGQAAQQAQSAGYGEAALGSQAQNAALTGAQAQLASGGLQQQLQQAQLNAPYQQQVAQAQFPYQQAQFYGSLVGALAPGLGGTTYGQNQSTSTPAQPSIWSQLLGAGTAAAGAYGQYSQGKGSGTPWNTQAGYASGQLANNAGSSYYGPGFARGGSAHPFYDDGGSVRPPLQITPQIAARFQNRAQNASDDNALRRVVNDASKYGVDWSHLLNKAGGGAISHPFYDDGGEVPGQPIDIAAHPFIPESKITPIQPHIPQLQQQQQQSGGGGGSSGGGFGDILSAGLKLAAMFKDGGAVDMKKFDGHDPYTFFQNRFPKGYADGGAPDDDEPFRMPDAAAVDAWRQGADTDRTAGLTATQSDVPLPTIITEGTKQARKATPSRALAFGPEAASAAPDTSAAATAPATSAAMPGAKHDRSGFIDSPWAALTAAGLGIMGGTSPFAGVNIGQGGMQGLKMLETQRENVRKDETVEQSAKRLEQEAKFHEDQYSRMTMAQKQAQQQADRPYEELTAGQKAADKRAQQQQEFAEKQANRPYEQLTKAQQVQADEAKQRDDLARQQFNRPYEELTKAQQAQLEESKRQHELARVPQGFRVKDDGTMEPIEGGPHSPAQIKAESEAKRPPGMSDEAMEPLVDSYMKGNTGVLTGVGRGTQGAQNLEKFWTMTAQKLKDQGKGGADLAAARANFMAQSAAARTAAQREATVATAVNEAKGTFPQVLQASAKLPRSEFVPFNAALNFARTMTGSEPQRAYGAALQAAVTAYSQAMSRTGANSVYAQTHAAEVLSKADGPKAIAASIKQLQIEMDIAKAAPEETRQDILNHILGVPSGQQGQAAQPAAGGPPVPAAAPQVDEVRTNAHGVKGRWNGTAWEVIQ